MHSNNAKDRFLHSMRQEGVAHSPLSQYLSWLRSQGEDGAVAAETLEADLIECFTDDVGLRVLKLFEKSVLLLPVPNGSSDGALREMNAVRNFVHEIRRIVSHG